MLTLRQTTLSEESLKYIFFIFCFVKTATKDPFIIFIFVFCGVAICFVSALV